MSDNEKRVLVLEADKSNLNQFIFDLSWEHLDKITANEISRSEAIELMAKAIKSVPKASGEAVHSTDYAKWAEAALDALLGDKK